MFLSCLEVLSLSCSPALPAEAFQASGTPTKSAYMEPAVPPTMLQAVPGESTGIPTLSLSFSGMATVDPSSRSTPVPGAADQASPTIAEPFRVSTTPMPTQGQTPGTPTLAMVFIPQSPIPTLTLPAFAEPSSPTRVQPAAEASQAGSGGAAVQPADLSQYDQLSVFADELAPGWSVDQSWDTKVDLQADTAAHQGSKAIQVTPLKDFGALFFTLQPGSNLEILKKNTFGVSFWLRAGDQPIQLDQLAVTILGSNANHEFVKDDPSVQTDQSHFFSETRLYLLDFNSALPPNTWGQVIIRLKDLVYDPEYTYITGIYIKNAAGFLQTYSVDDVTLLEYKNNGQ